MRIHCHSILAKTQLDAPLSKVWVDLVFLYRCYVSIYVYFWVYLLNLYIVSKSKGSLP